MRTTGGKKWDRESVLKRLMRIAEEARQATFTERSGKNGETTLEYDTKCATIELKAVEYAVKLSGMLEEEKGEEIVVRLDGEADDLSQ